MRTETTTQYYKEFEELSEDDKKVILDRGRYHNTEHLDWWSMAYEDMKNVGIKCHGFDIDRGSNCDLEFIGTAEETAHAIIENHGAKCATHDLASIFIQATNTVSMNEDNDDEDLPTHFRHDLQEEYLALLRKEYEYLTSDDAVKESVLCNGIEFQVTKEGALI